MVRLPFPGGHSPGSGMGHFRVSIQVGRRGGERFAPLDALVDTGATYTWVPGDVLEGVGVAPEERSEEHTSELQSHHDLVCRLLLEKKKKKQNDVIHTRYSTDPAHC